MSDLNVFCALGDANFNNIGNCVMVNTLGVDFTMILVFIFIFFAFLMWMGRLPLGVALMIGLGLTFTLGLMNQAFNGLFILGIVFTGGLLIVGIIRATNG